ncbi:hypothetical protein [Candidatus Coxiella mudrowiae]|uniref:hypothetical protein n=1 Tax=Candidatus Coxiella mudrowiae TaxID=2054173 RepID=UPI0006624BFC|nr:hypothetical protein [Candidatus Coxiella mudrowiae]
MCGIETKNLDDPTNENQACDNGNDHSPISHPHPDIVAYHYQNSDYKSDKTHQKHNALMLSQSPHQTNQVVMPDEHE